VKVNKYKTLLTTLVALFLIGPNVLAGELIVPDDTWEPIFFESINKLSSAVGLKNLRNYFPKNNDLEIRFWSGFGKQPLSGFVLKRSNGVWHGLYITERFRKEGLAVKSHPVAPQNWDYLWQKLDACGIMSLPDSSQLKNEVLVLDGISYVVELNYKNRYRTYQYGNPKEQPWPEAIQIQKIAYLLNKELLEKDLPDKKDTTLSPEDIPSA